MASSITPMSESTAVLPEARSHSPWRRSACDRCRSQKLRCTRKKEDDTSTPCTRCLRIRFPCFTSPAKPPGRLAHRRAAAAAAANNTSLCDVEQRQLPFVPLPGSGHGMPLADPMTCGNPLYAPWSYTQQEAEHPLVIEDNSLALAWTDGSHGIDSFDFSVHTNPLLMDTHTLYGNHHMHPSAQYQTPIAPIPSPPEYQQVQGLSLQDDYSTKAAPLSKSRPSDPGVLLASLQQSLSKQLLHAKSLPREFSILDTLSNRTTNKTTDGFDPLASVLSSTCDLIEISQLFHRASDVGTPQSSHKRSPSIIDDGGASVHGGSRWPSPASNASQIPSQGYSLTHSAGSSTAASSPSSSTIIDPALGGGLPTTQRQTQQLSSANLLTMVSCYLQLITIYDAIFGHVLLEAAFAVTRRSNGNSINMQHALAHAMPIDLSRGYPGHHESFNSQYSQTAEVNHWQRAALLAQMVDRQLEGVERALGLPREYCVSTSMRLIAGEEDIELGLLSGREARGLLGVLLGGPVPGMMYGEGEVMMDGFVAASVEQEGGNMVTMLREKLGGLLQNLAGGRC